MNNYLNDGEKLALESFIENQLMFHAVKKVLLAPLYEWGTLKAGEEAHPLQNWAAGVVLNQKIDLQGRPKDDPQDYEKIGQRIFAIVEGLNFIESGFKEIEKYKRVQKEVEKKVNEAR